MALPTVPEERDYGAVQEQERLEAAAPAPIEATPEQMDVASEGAVAQVAQQYGTGAEPDEFAQQPQGYTVKNPYMLMPYQMWKDKITSGERTKTPTEADYDVGTMFRVLGALDPTMRVIADELTGS